MSGFRPIELDQFYRSLHGRGLDTTVLARAVGRSRATVTRVLNGSRRRGPVWKKLTAILTTEEQHLLHVAQCSTWHNAARGTASAWPNGRAGKPQRSARRRQHKTN